MSDTFQCAKCGAQYTRERRRVGRAVLCSCGHKFLVPPPDDDPRDAPATSSRPPARGRTMDDADDSSSEAIPLAELVADSSAPVRWAEPIEEDEPLPAAEVVVEEDKPLPVAEIVYAAPAAPAYPVEDLFAAGGPYADPLNSLDAPAMGRRVPATKKRSGRRKREGMHANVTDVIASIALFGLLPIGTLFFALGLVQYFRLGRLLPEDAHRLPPPPALNGGLPPAPMPPAPMAPSASGALPILVVRVAKKQSSDEFTLEYDVRHGALNAASQYFWIISSLGGKIEFQIPTPAPGRGSITGKPDQPTGLSPPFTAYIEEQSAGGRTRVSNDVAVIVGG